MAVSEFGEGDRVHHPAYGAGEVVRVLGFARQERVRVAWDAKADATSVLAANLSPHVEVLGDE